MYSYSEEDEYVNERGSKKAVFHMAIELCSGGELFDFVAQTGRFSEPVARFYFKQFLSGLEYMHIKKGMAHRDLKPENLLFDENFNLKIADFGFVSSKSVNNTYKGTPNYMAPEILNKQKYSGNSCDLFASAIILFIMVTQRPPHNKASPTDVNYKYIHGNRLDLFWKKYDRYKLNLSEEFTSLINVMMQPTAAHRLSLAEILSHPWMQGETPTHEEVLDEFMDRRRNLDGFSETEAAEPTDSPSAHVF